MIHASERYRFIQEIQDRAFYEEEVVQHILMEHRAARRSFSEKGSRDPVAAEEIRAQAALAAGCNAPALPIVYVLEEVKGRITIVYELVQGQPLEEMINRGRFSKPRDWADFALRLCDELLEIRRVGGRLDRIAIDQLAITPSNEVRFIHRHSVGAISRERVESSQYLQRLMVTPSGVYTSKGEELAEDTELLALRELLTRAGCGSTKKTYDALRAEVVRAPEMHSSPLASVDHGIAEVLSSMRVSAFDGAPLGTLEKVREAIAALKREAAYAGGRETQSTIARPSSSEGTIPPAGGQGTASPWTSPAQTEYRSAAPTPPPTPSRAPSAPPPRPVPTGPVVEDDANPFLAGPSTRPTVPSAAAALTTSALQHPATSRRPFPWVGVVSTLVAAAVVAGLVIVVAPLMKGRAPNVEPVAAIAPLATASVRNGDRVILDAGPSSDPEGEPLAYHWRYVAPGDGTVLFAEPGSSRPTSARSYSLRSATVQMQFLTTGRNTMELRVYDGAFMSEPVEVVVEVVP